LLLCVAVSACAPKATRFVLVPDREGHVGTVTVTNQAGSATLDQPQQGVLVASAQSAPGRPEIVPASTIQQVFGEALAAEPPAPLVCLVYFATGSSDIDAAAAQEIEKAVAEVARRASLDVSVDGHSDTTGNPAVNLRVSMARAAAVRDRLVAAGVPAEIIAVRHHGRGVLLVPTGDNVDEPRNRRVEIIVR